MKRLILTLVTGLYTAQAPAQTFSTLKTFGIMSDVTGFTPYSEVVEGPDGTLYGTMSTAEGNIGGTVYKMQPDGSDFTVLKWFLGPAAREGAYPWAGLTLSGSVLYGTTSYGGSLNHGTVFRCNTDGTGFTVLKDFNKDFSASEGSNPYASLTVSGSVLYGTTFYGGTSDRGTLFKLNSDGTGFMVLKDFDGSDGSWPSGALTLSGSVLYGTASGGGPSGRGTIFKLNTDGTGYTVLKDFATLSEGRNLRSDLTLSGNVLYGTASEGGSANYGTVFKVNTDGTGFAVLKHFTGLDGRRPSASLTLSGGVLYGTTVNGGSANYGTVFKCNTNGTGYAVIRHFTGSNGREPYAGLMLSGSVLYGTTSLGGASEKGTIFKLNTNGTGATVLKHPGVVNNTEARTPSSGLTLSGNVLYGTTRYGGSSDYGTVFKISADGTGYAVLNDFTGGAGVDERHPLGNLTLSDGVLYGTTAVGVVFKMDTDGTGFTVLKRLAPSEGIYYFTGLTLSGNMLYGVSKYSHNFDVGTLFRLNTDGTDFTVLKQFSTDSVRAFSGPSAEMTISGNTLYGTTVYDGSQGFGTVFKLNTDGTDFTVLKHFAGSDGAQPRGALTLSGNVLYGTTSYGGSSDLGTIFTLNVDGTGYTVLKHFDGSDGAHPHSALTLSGSSIYGTTVGGGSSSNGVVFKLNTDGTGYTALKHFSGDDGAYPSSSLAFSGSMLYGTTSAGGSWNNGTIFKMDLAPVLSIHSTASNAVQVSWPSAWEDVVLQENRNGLSALNWRNVTDPIQDDGTNRTLVVNPTDASRFYRLVRP